MDTIEARRIQSFLSEFDVDRAEKGTLIRAEDILYMAAEQRYSFPPTADERSGHWLNLRTSEGPGVEVAVSEIIGVETQDDMPSGAIE